jgi:hypothetical protein
MLTLPTLLRNKQKSLLMNPAWNTVKDGIIVPPAQAIAIPAATSALNLGQASDQIIEAPSDGYCELYALIGALTSSTASVLDRILVMFRDTGIVERRLMNRPVQFNHIFGSAANPMYIRCEDGSQSLWMDPLQILLITLINSSAADTATASLAGMFTKYQLKSMEIARVKKYVNDSRARYRQITPYWWTMDQNITGQNVAGVTIAAGSTVDCYFTGPSDVELSLTSVTATAIPASAGGAGDTGEKFTAQFWDARTDRPYQNQPLTLNTGFGTPSFPHYFDVPIVVPPTYKVRSRFTNLITDRAIDLFVTFHGVANYNYEAKYLP